MDVLGAIDYVARRDISVEYIGILAFSLRAGVAILGAAREPSIPAVVSDSGFRDYTMDLCRLSLGPFYLPTWFAIFVLLAGRQIFSADFGKVRPAQVVNGISQPIFFIHGEDDPVISTEKTVQLHIISDNQDDRIWIVPGAEHANIFRKIP